MFSQSIGLGKWLRTIDNRCNHKFGSILYALKFLVSDSKFNHIIDRLNKRINTLNLQLHTIPITEVLKRMGISPLMAKEFGIIVR